MSEDEPVRKTFRERYSEEKRWLMKVLIMSNFHHTMKLCKGTWSVKKTAIYFKVSVGLVSENLKLASCAEHLTDCVTRKDGLNRISNIGE